jgi:hypothetical protein
MFKWSLRYMYIGQWPILTESEVELTMIIHRWPQSGLTLWLEQTEYKVYVYFKIFSIRWSPYDFVTNLATFVFLRIDVVNEGKIVYSRNARWNSKFSLVTSDTPPEKHVNTILSRGRKCRQFPVIWLVERDTPPSTVTWSMFGV